MVARHHRETCCSAAGADSPLAIPTPRKKNKSRIANITRRELEKRLVLGADSNAYLQQALWRTATTIGWRPRPHDSNRRTLPEAAERLDRALFRQKAANFALLRS